MILLGSVQRFELERLLLVHLSKDQKVLWHWGALANSNGRNGDSDSSSSNSRGNSPTKQHTKLSEPAGGGDTSTTTPAQPAGGAATAGPGLGVPVSGPRFRVTKVNETELKTNQPEEPETNGEAIPMKLLSVVSTEPFQGTGY